MMLCLLGLCIELLQVAFAAGASVLVKAYAIYARHSGIPEIKTVLGGFVIQRFMGAWTLVVKSLGLASLSSHPVPPYHANTHSVWLWLLDSGLAKRAPWFMLHAAVQC